nr:DUF4157 domain-containing protein [Candidatus Electrothrix aestuarii]
MSEHKEKEQKSGMVTGLTGVAQRKKRGRAKGFAFEDNRPETAQLRGLFPQRPSNEAGRPVLQAKDFHEGKQLKPQEPVQKKENKTGLPDDLKAGVENLSGLAMDDVRVSYNSDKPAQLNAHAYTQGTKIHVAPGQEKHLPHEAWHVVQQKEGRVRPTVQMKGGVPVNDDGGLEREADVLGEKAIQFMENRRERIPRKKNNDSGMYDKERGHRCSGIFQLIKYNKNYNNSGKLARARYKRGGGKKGKGRDFSTWKRGREAQHLIPAQVCKEFLVPEAWANSAENGMMLPSGRHGTVTKRLTALDKGKRFHIKGGGAHPQYNIYVNKQAKKRGWVAGKVKKEKFLALARFLRKKNRPTKKGPAKGYVNDIT